MLKKTNKIRAKIIKQQQILKDKVINFFDWVKGAKLIELNECDTSEDPGSSDVSHSLLSLIHISEPTRPY